MAIIQVPSIAAVVEDPSPQLAGALDCQDYNLNDVGTVNWYDASVEYDASVLFGTTLYFQPSTGNGTYVFRGSSSTRYIEHQITSTEVQSSVGSTITSYSWRGNNASCVFNWEAGAGGTTNMQLDTSGLELRNGTSLVQAHVYGTYTDASNYERLTIGRSGSVFVVQPEAAGTGSEVGMRFGNSSFSTPAYITFSSGGDVSLYASGIQVVTLQSDNMTVRRALRTSSDSAFDIGQSTVKFRSIYGDTINVGDGFDANITADADHEVALRDGTSAQQLSVYNTYTDSSNYERLGIYATGSKYVIKSQWAGTGSNRSVEIDGSQVNLKYQGLTRLRTGSSSLITFVAMTPSTDGAVNSGIDTLRWNALYTKGVNTNLVTATGTTYVTDAQSHTVLCDCSSNAITVTLPAADVGRVIVIKKIDSTANTVTINPEDGAETIDGAASATISSQYDSLTLQYDGGDWWII